GGERVRKIGKQCAHLGAGLEAMLVGEAAPVVVGNKPAVGYADQGIVGFVVVAGGEERLIGGDERDASRVGKLDEGGFGDTLGVGAMPLQLDIEPVAEQACERL